MNSLNQAQIIGNITRDVEIKTTQGGQMVCTIGVATNRNWTAPSGERQEHVEFHNIVCWGKLAELCGQLLQKGSKVYFSGRMQTRNWEDEAGHKNYRTEIIAQDMIVFGPRKGGGEQEQSFSQNEKAQEPDLAEMEIENNVDPKGTDI